MKSLGTCWIVYGILRVCLGIAQILFAPTATVMFGSLLNRVANPFTLMGIFHVFYVLVILLSLVCGVLGILGGLAIFLTILIGEPERLITRARRASPETSPSMAPAVCRARTASQIARSSPMGEEMLQSQRRVSSREVAPSPVKLAKNSRPNAAAPERWPCRRKLGRSSPRPVSISSIETSAQAGASSRATTGVLRCIAHCVSGLKLGVTTDVSNHSH